MRIIAIFLIATASGCAFTPQTIEFAPVTTVTSSMVGAGQAIGLTVVDERSEEEIGHRGAGFSKGASITTEQDLAAVVQSSLIDMLGQKGFSVEPGNGGSPSLRIDIRGLNYSTSTGFWTGGVQVTAAMKAIAVGESETYENFYRYDEEKRVVVVPGANSNSQQINDALTDVLHQIVSDNKLLEVLAQE